MIKMIVTDLDGTLLNDDEEISQYTLSTLEKCKKRGIKIVIATARSKMAAEKYIDLVKPDFSVLNDGGLILNETREIIHDELISFDSLDYLNYKYLENVNDKINAIQILSESQNIPLSEILAFGDGINDIEMIEKCGVGIAAENAIQAVKRHAQGICGTNNEDGVARWIKENILSEFGETG